MLPPDRMTSRHNTIIRIGTGLTGAALALYALGSLTGCTEPPQEEPVIAMINGRSITRLSLTSAGRTVAGHPRPVRKKGGKRRFLDELIMRELLMQERASRGLDQSDEIREKTLRYREQLILDELLKDRTGTQGLRCRRKN